MEEELEILNNPGNNDKIATSTPEFIDDPNSYSVKGYQEQLGDGAMLLEESGETALDYDFVSCIFLLAIFLILLFYLFRKITK